MTASEPCENQPRRGCRLRLGNLSVDTLTFEGAIDEIEDLVKRRCGGAVFTPNVDHVVLAEEDERFRAAYARADLCLADGMFLVWASKMFGTTLPAKISGSDLVLPLMERARARGWRTYLLGGADGVAQKASVELRARLPGVEIVGVSSPRVDMSKPAKDRSAVASAVGAVRPDVVLVAFGAPKQELWIDESLPLLRPAVLIGVGGSLDFIAGTVRRAPAWVSAAGLEWAYRLWREPRRLWRRYLVRDPKFLLILLRQRFAIRRGQTSGREP